MTNALQPVVDFIQKVFRPRNANQGGKNSPRSLCFMSALLNILVDNLHKSYGDKGKNKNASPPTESDRGGLGEEPSISTSGDSVGRLSGERDTVDCENTCFYLSCNDMNTNSYHVCGTQKLPHRHAGKV